MTELQQMQARIEQLEQDTQERIAQFEQDALAAKSKSKAQNMRHRFAMGLAVVGIGLSLMAQKGITQATPGVLVCRQLKVVDEAGTNLIVLGSAGGERPGGLVSVYNYFDKRTTSIGSIDGEGSLEVYDWEGKKVVQLYAKDGAGRVWNKKE